MPLCAPGLARALVPRSITVALALPIAAQLSAPAPIVAAGVCLTGLLGANFAQVLCASTDDIQIYVKIDS
jgi:putative effector of murein hydrolase